MARERGYTLPNVEDLTMADASDLIQALRKIPKNTEKL